jgi:hypothetical protein
MGLMAALALLRGNAEGAEPPVRQYPAHGKPWHDCHVPKAARKGKTPEEIETLRRELWERDKRK